MLRRDKYAEGTRCDGVSRRHAVRLGAMGALGLGFPELLAAQSNRSDTAPFARSVAKSCILIWLDGGPSHLEMYDLKPDAPSEVRGPFQPKSTVVPGIEVCELMPHTAQLMEHFALIRSMTSPLGEHNFGTHYLMTGYRPNPALQYPSMGSVVSMERQKKRDLPGHIAVPRFRVGGSSFTGGGYLPIDAHPFSIEGDPSKADFRVRDLEFYTGLNRDRVERRRLFLEKFNEFANQTGDGVATDPQLDQAYRLILSQDARAAFEVRQEPQEIRSMYGPKTFGQSCLLARRLIERGVPFVTVNYPGWDTHANVYTRLKEGYTGAKVPVGLIPTLDLGLGGLIRDLKRLGRLDETLIVVMGEFGRTPKLNTQGGRDHWPRVFSVALAGGGIRGGQVIGSSDPTGEGPHERPVTPADLAYSIFHLMGIDPRKELRTPDGRPVQINRDGQLVTELVT